MTSSPARWALALAAVALLSACSGGSDSPSAKATPSASATTADPVQPSPACDFLTPAERQELAGVAVDTVVSSGSGDGSSQCRWQEAAALIQVTTLPAKEWAKSLPDVVAQLESSSDISSAADKKDLARAKKLLSGAASFTDGQACSAFVTLAELGGEKKGSRTTVTTVPITDTESGISAQTCSSGQLTSIIYSVPGLKETTATDTSLTRLLATVQKRASA